jgi:rubrerythrin
MHSIEDLSEKLRDLLMLELSAKSMYEQMLKLKSAKKYQAVLTKIMHCEEKHANMVKKALEIISSLTPSGR